MNRHMGQRFEDFLDEIGEREEVDLLARKKLLALAFRTRMEQMKLSPTTLARRMKSSRDQIYRLLDPTDPGVTLDTLHRASRALDLDLKISTEARGGPKKRAA